MNRTNSVAKTSFAGVALLGACVACCTLPVLFGSLGLGALASATLASELGVLLVLASIASMVAFVIVFLRARLARQQTCEESCSTDQSCRVATPRLDEQRTREVQ